MVDREEVGQNEMRTCQLGREVVGQCIYRGTVDGVEDKEEGGLQVRHVQKTPFFMDPHARLTKGGLLVPRTLVCL